MSLLLKHGAPVNPNADVSTNGGEATPVQRDQEQVTHDEKQKQSSDEATPLVINPLLELTRLGNVTYNNGEEIVRVARMLIEAKADLNSRMTFWDARVVVRISDCHSVQ